MVNVFSVLVAAIVSLALGNLWFGPLFGRTWARAAGVKLPEETTPEDRKGMGKSVLLNFIGTIVMAFVVGWVFIFGSAFTGTGGIPGAIVSGFYLWIGIAAPILLGAVLWEKKPWKWWFIMIGYYLVAFILQGIVFALWG
jgi:hypothetical protein